MITYQPTGRFLGVNLTLYPKGVGPIVPQFFHTWYIAEFFVARGTECHDGTDQSGTVLNPPLSVGALIKKLLLGICQCFFID